MKTKLKYCQLWVRLRALSTLTCGRRSAHRGVEHGLERLKQVQRHSPRPSKSALRRASQSPHRNLGDGTSPATANIWKQPQCP